MQVEANRGPDEGGAAVDYVMDDDLALSQSITKRLDLVGGAECDVMIRQPDARALALAELVHEIRDVETRADVEIRVIERKKELEDLTARPGS